MSATFKAHIQENCLGGWFIKITDLQTQEEIICNTLDEFSTQIEFMGAPYNNAIEVQWSKADNLTPEHFYEVKQQMAKINKELHQDD
jgi:hypothetical protein